MAVQWNRGLTEQVRQAINREIVVQTEEVRNEAIRLILDTPKTGRLYKRRGGKMHQASAPGEPPASDYGRLVNSIRTDYDLQASIGTVTASTKYAAGLEFGTARMAARPFMRTALSNRHKEIIAGIQGAVRAALGE